MDPLSIASSAAALVVLCSRIVNLCNIIAGQQKRINRTLIALRTEIVAYQVSLNHIQDLLLEQNGPFAEFLVSNETWFQSFDTALSACGITVSILISELQKVIERSTGNMSQGILNEGDIKSLTDELQGQKGAVQLLIQTLQMKSTAHIMELLVREGELLQNLRRQTATLSVTWEVHDLMVGDARDGFSIFNVDLSEKTFEFDNEISKMGPYRRALASQRQHSSQQQIASPIGNLLDDDHLIDLSFDALTPGRWTSELQQEFAATQAHGRSDEEDQTIGRPELPSNDSNSSTKNPVGRQNMAEDGHETVMSLGDGSKNSAASSNTEQLNFGDDNEREILESQEVKGGKSGPADSETFSTFSHETEPLGHSLTSNPAGTPALVGAGKKTVGSQVPVISGINELTASVPTSKLYSFMFPFSDSDPRKVNSISNDWVADLKNMKIEAPLHHASLKGDCKKLGALLSSYEQGSNKIALSDALQRLYAGRNVLDYAVIGGRDSLSSLELLLGLPDGAHNLPDRADDTDLTPLDWAVICGNMDAVKILMKRSYRLSSQINLYFGNSWNILTGGWTTISLALYCENLRIARLLMDEAERTKHTTTGHPAGLQSQQANLKPPMEELRQWSKAELVILPPLHGAVANLQYLIIANSRYLLPSQAKGNSGSSRPDYDLLNPSLLKRLKHQKTERSLKRSGSGSAQKCLEAINIFLNSFVTHIDVRLELSRQDAHGFTALHAACCGNFPPVVEKLLELGGFVPVTEYETSSRVGQTNIVTGDPTDSPLHLAAFWNRAEVVKLLLKRGIEPGVEGLFERAPIHYAAAMGHLDVVRLLADAGAEIDNLADGETPLSHSLRGGHWEVASFLIKSGADLKKQYPIRPYGSENIIHKVISIDFSAVAVVKFLLENGALPNTKNDLSQTALHVLLHNYKPFSKDDFLAILECLIRHGIHLNTRELGRRTPLHIAVQMGSSTGFRLETITALLDAGADPELRNSYLCSSITLVKEMIGHNNGIGGIILRTIATEKTKGGLGTRTKTDREEDEKILQLLEAARGRPRVAVQDNNNLTAIPRDKVFRALHRRPVMKDSTD